MFARILENNKLFNAALLNCTKRGSRVYHDSAARQFLFYVKAAVYNDDVLMTRWQMFDMLMKKNIVGVKLAFDRANIKPFFFFLRIFTLSS